MLHKYIFDGTRIVVDINSGSVHVVDGLTWEILDGYETQSPDEILAGLKLKYAEAEILEALREIRDLKEAGQLFTPDTPLTELRLPDQPVVKSLCLHIAHDCNLRCRYCFASSGHFGGERELMSGEVGRAALDFLLEASGPRKNCEVDFFGGEPLLNFSTVQQLVDYGRQEAAKRGKVFRFTLTTNGVLLDEKVEQWLNEHEIAVVLSLDGRKEVNDRMRTYVNGSGCYDTIVPRIQRFVRSRHNQNYYVRGTYTAKNLDFSHDVLHLAELGFEHISVEPVVAPEQEEYAFQTTDLPRLLEEYEGLTRMFLERRASGKPFNFFHFNLDLSGGPCLAKRLSGCGAGHEYMAVSPKGELYPCHQFVGREGFRLGNVFERKLNLPVMKSFQQAHIYNKPKCVQCWAKFYCSGGCHANAQAVNGTLLEPHDIGCQLEKKRLECAIYLQVKKAQLA